MEELNTLKEKIEIIRNDTNAYGFDDDNKTIAEALELVSDMLGKNNSSQGEAGKDGESIIAIRVETEEEALAQSQQNPNGIYYTTYKVQN